MRGIGGGGTEGLVPCSGQDTGREKRPVVVRVYVEGGGRGLCCSW